jgi:hypothetical protein
MTFVQGMSVISLLGSISIACWLIWAEVRIIRMNGGDK